MLAYSLRYAHQDASTNYVNLMLCLSSPYRTCVQVPTSHLKWAELVQRVARL